MLRHHSSTISGPSITFQAFPSHSITLLSLPVHSVPYSVHSVNIPVLRYRFRHHRFSLLFSFSLCTLFLSLVLRFYLYPVSIPSFSISARQSAGQSCLSNITINRLVVLSHFTVHPRFLSIYKPVDLGS